MTQDVNQHTNPEGAVCQVWSATNEGGDIVPVRIECGLGRGFSGIVMLGGVGRICEDGKERAKAGLERLGWTAPARKTIISISPGDLKIDRPHIDLALCVAMAGVTQQNQWIIKTTDWLFAAEVGLNGELRPVPGVVAWASVAMERGLRGIVVSVANLRELDCMRSLGDELHGNFHCIGFSSLKDVFSWLGHGCMSQTDLSGLQDFETSVETEVGNFDFDDMNLSADLELIAGVVAAGSHSLLLRGSPGTGKSMFARRLSSIMPPMSPRQHLQSLRVYSAVGANVPDYIIKGRAPFRAPHHYTSLAAMVGTPDRPGELSLASGGVLFLDELPEFRRDVLEGLREPLETGEVAVSRAHGRQVWSAEVLLIAAANNCPCGWSGSRKRRCECLPSRLNAYRSRLSGPLQDRIDLHLNMPEPDNQISALVVPQAHRLGQTSRLKERVKAAREAALSRHEITGVFVNRDIPSKQIFSALKIPRHNAEALVTKIIPAYSGTRSIIRCLRVARTIADIMGSDQVHGDHLSMAWGWQATSAAKLRGELIPLP